MPKAKRQRPGLKPAHSDAASKRQILKGNLAKPGWRARLRSVSSKWLAGQQGRDAEQKPAEDRVLPRWGAIAALIPLLCLAAWAVSELAVPNLIDVVRSGPAIGLGIVAVIFGGVNVLDVVPIKPTRQMEVLAHRTASWTVGETKVDCQTRMSSISTTSTAEQYPDNYPGLVISVRNRADVVAGKMPTLENMADKDRLFFTLDLTETEILALSSKTMKIDVANKRPVLRTFGDRFGAVAIELAKKHADPEVWEAEEKARVTSEETANELATSSGLSCHEVAPSSFDLEMVALTKALPQTDTHTGTGMYWTKATPLKNDDTQSGAPAGQVITLVTGGLGADAFVGGYVLNVTRTETRAIVSHSAGDVTLEGSLTNWLDTDDLDIFDSWSTIQAAEAQLLTDQGSTEFSAEQEIRLFDGTYSEAVTTTLLRPSVKARFAVRAAPGQTAVIHSNSGTGAVPWTFGSSMRGNQIFEGFTISGDDVVNDIFISSRGSVIRLVNMVLDGQSNIARAWATFAVHTKGCIFRDFTQHAVQLAAGCSLVNTLFENCGSFEVGIGSNIFHGCTFDTTFVEVTSAQNIPQPVAGNQFYNCTFYNVTSAFDSSLNDGLNISTMNCIFDTCTTVYDGGTAGGMDLQADFNIFNGVTNFAIIAGAAVTTLTAWQATVNYDGTSPDANSLEVDPLLTDPGSGDFSLSTGSPAQHRGRGSGVINDVNGDPFDPYHPDIGSVSTGIGPNIAVGS